MPDARCPSLNDCVDLLLDAICVVDPEGRFLYVSAAAERIFGYTPEEMLGRRMIELVHPDDRDLTLRTVRDIMADKPQPHFENRYIRKDGRSVWIMWSARWSARDGVRIAVARDISARKRAEMVHAALYAISESAHASDDLSELFEQIHQIVAGLLPVQRFCIALWQPGISQLQLVYRSGMADGEDGCASPDWEMADLCERVLRADRPLYLPLTGASGAEENWLGVPLKSAAGPVGVMLVLQATDHRSDSEADDLLHFVSTQIASAIERKQMYERLEYYAFYDTLTRLPNRALFHDRMQLALMRARREGGRLALLYVDLDRFKEVNDGWGHTIGDILLEKVARMLEMSVRECDTVARFGGDEFVILLEQCNSLEQARQVADKLRALCRQPMAIAGMSLSVDLSIGIAVYPEDGADEQQLLRHADQAMYRLKGTE